MSGTRLLLSELSRPQLEKLVEAHREEFVDTFRQDVHNDVEQAEDCLNDFEREALGA